MTAVRFTSHHSIFRENNARFCDFGIKTGTLSLLHFFSVCISLLHLTYIDPTFCATLLYLYLPYITNYLTVSICLRDDKTHDARYLYHLPVCLKIHSLLDLHYIILHSLSLFALHFEVEKSK